MREVSNNSLKFQRDGQSLTGGARHSANDSRAQILILFASRQMEPDKLKNRFRKIVKQKLACREREANFHNIVYLLALFARFNEPAALRIPGYSAG